METQSPLLPGSPLVDIEDLSLFLPGDARQKMILHHIDWHLCRGEHHLLLGHNGAGKTTLMRLMHGLLWPAEGRIVWHTSEGEETSPIAGRAVSALVSPDQQENYQRQRWYITGRELLLTAFEDTPLLYTNTSEQRHAQVEDMARRLRALDLLDRMVPEVSQGQLRLLLLGRALVRLEEPAAGAIRLDGCDWSTLKGRELRRFRRRAQMIFPLFVRNTATVFSTEKDAFVMTMRPSRTGPAAAKISRETFFSIFPCSGQHETAFPTSSSKELQREERTTPSPMDISPCSLENL